MHSKTPTFEVPQIAMVTENAPPSTEFLESAYKIGLSRRNVLLNVRENDCHWSHGQRNLGGGINESSPKAFNMCGEILCVATLRYQRTRFPKTHFWKHCFRSMCGKEITLGKFCKKWSKDINMYEPFNFIQFKNKKVNVFILNILSWKEFF